MSELEMTPETAAQVDAEIAQVRAADKIAHMLHEIHQTINVELDKIADPNKREWQELYSIYQSIGANCTTARLIRDRVTHYGEVPF